MPLFKSFDAGGNGVEGRVGNRGAVKIYGTDDLVTQSGEQSTRAIHTSNPQND